MRNYGQITTKHSPLLSSSPSSYLDFAGLAFLRQFAFNFLVLLSREDDESRLESLGCIWSLLETRSGRLAARWRRWLHLGRRRGWLLHHGWHARKGISWHGSRHEVWRIRSHIVGKVATEAVVLHFEACGKVERECVRQSYEW